MSRFGYLLFGFVLASAFYLLLIDTVSSPELLAGAGVTLLAAAAYEASREEGLLEGRLKLRWLARVPQVIASVPLQCLIAAREAIGQCLSPRTPSCGRFRAVPFEASAETGLDAGRRAIAEAVGSFAPNTIVVGIDPERNLLLAHQLRPSRGSQQLDPLALGQRTGETE